MSSSDITSTKSQSHPAAVSTSSAPPAKISTNSHLDPSSYVKGKHQLTIESNAIIHPRTYLFTELGPLTIRQGSIIAEKCVIGRRDKTESNHQRNQPSTASALARPLSTIIQDRDGDTPITSTDVDDNLESKSSASILPEITIGPNAHLHASVTVQAPSTIGEFAIIEPGVMISPNCSIGAHSKICAGITLPPGTTVPDWTVVYGINGQMRRRRTPSLAEEARLEVLRCERQGVEALLKMNASKGLAQAGAGPVKSKRESMIRG